MIKDDVIQLVLEFTYKYISPKQADQIIALIELPKGKPPDRSDREKIAAILFSGNNLLTWDACNKKADQIIALFYGGKG